ncbi:MAG: hypothetical protein U5N86_07875 [Planctomycetota bacterium]|nr:hypothetical protein [Planctomycetota bacterium]
MKRIHELRRVVSEGMDTGGWLLSFKARMGQCYVKRVHRLWKREDLGRPQTV